MPMVIVPRCCSNSAALAESMSAAMTDRLQQLTAILECSHHMLECARGRRWDDLPSLEAGRSLLIEGYGRQSKTRSRDDDLDAEADMLARIIAINEELVALGSAQKKELADTLSGNRRQRDAAVAYSATSTRRLVV